jgi:quinol monooxygenase YgiN
VEEVTRVVAVWQPAAGQCDAVRAIVSELAAATREEPGCLSFEALESVEPPGCFVLLENYAGAAARQAHLASRHFRDLVLGRAVPLLALRDVRTYRLAP